jgi:hypothetical protein
MRRAALLCGTLLALALTGPPAFADAAMQGAAEAFYKVYAAQPHGGLPDATQRMHYAPVLSPRLDALLTAAAAAQVRFSAKARGAAPPMIAGDLFTSNFEGAAGWTLGPCSGDASTAHCPVTLTRQSRDHKTIQWHDELTLVRAGGGWKVDDVVYDPAFADGNTGSLTQMLRMVLSEAPS